jgi:single-strand DNA-binding protein
LAQNINQVVITGNLTRDPELRHLPSGTSVCTLGVAVNETYKSDDEWKERANFFDVVVWGKQGEACDEYLEKGRPVAIAGRLRYESWEAEDGSKRSKVKIVADRVQFLNSGEKRSSSSSRDSESSQLSDDDDFPF